MSCTNACKGAGTPRAHGGCFRKLRWLSGVETLLEVSAGLLLASVGGAVAQNADDPRDVLLLARQTVVNTLQRLPRYVCIRTIERSRYEPEGFDAAKEEVTSAPKP